MESGEWRVWDVGIEDGEWGVESADWEGNGMLVRGEDMGTGTGIGTMKFAEAVIVIGIGMEDNMRAMGTGA